MLDVIRRNSQSWVVKGIFGIIILVFVFWGANTVSTDSSRVLGEVDGSPLYRAELMQRFKLEMQRLRQANPEYSPGAQEQEFLARQVLQGMVIRALLRREASRLGLGISDAELSAHVASQGIFHDAAGVFNEAVYRNVLALTDLSVSRYEEMAEEEALLAKLRGYVGAALRADAAEARRLFDFELERRQVEYLAFPHAEYRKSVRPGEAELITFYSENSARWQLPARAALDYVFFDQDLLAGLGPDGPVGEEKAAAWYAAHKESFALPASMHTRHILVRLPLSLGLKDEEVNAAKARAESILAELKAGRAFAELARAHSDDETGREQGGDLGWTELGSLDQAYEEAALTLRPGESGALARTYNGFHIIELLGFKPAGERPFAEARGEILARLKEEAALNGLAAALSEAEDAVIGGLSLEDIAETIAAPHKPGLRETGLKEPAAIAAELKLPPAVLADLAALAPGSLLPAPVEIAGGFAVFRLKEYVPAHTPGLEAIRGEVSAAFTDKAAAELAGAAARAALDDIKAKGGVLPAALSKKLVRAEANRFSGVPQLAVTDPSAAFFPSDEQSLTQDIYLAGAGEWLPRAYAADKAQVLVRLLEVRPADPAVWESMGAAYVEGLDNMRRDLFFNLFLARLERQANIEIKAGPLLSFAP